MLILGDSISLGYTPPVRKLLTSMAEVLRPAENCQHTAYGLKRIDAWLGNSPVVAGVATGKLLLRGLADLANLYIGVMFVAIVDERNMFFGLLIAVEEDPLYRRTGACGPEGDVIRGFTVAVVDLERRQGAKRSLSTSIRNPSNDSVMSRYIQPAEPVYQVQPPRPV